MNQLRRKTSQPCKIFFLRHLKKNPNRCFIEDHREALWALSLEKSSSLFILVGPKRAQVSPNCFCRSLIDLGDKPSPSNLSLEAFLSKSRIGWIFEKFRRIWSKSFEIRRLTNGLIEKESWFEVQGFLVGWAKLGICCSPYPRCCTKLCNKNKNLREPFVPVTQTDDKSDFF